MNTLVDLIFKGQFEAIDFGFINSLIPLASEKRFMYPENTVVKSSEDIIQIFKANSYFDFVLSANYVDLLKKRIPNIFINIGRDSSNVDILFFFDLKDLGTDYKSELSFLHKWSSTFKKKYHFDSFICRMDGEEDGDNYYYQENWISI